MRYYDNASDTIIKGLIDLSDVESVTQGLPNSVYLQQTQFPQYTSTKKALNTLISGNSNNNSLLAANEIDNKCYFELRTNKRVYYFCAKSQQESGKWVNQLKTCCLDS